MKSIRSKLFSSYVFIIVVMLVPLIYLFFAQNAIVNRYTTTVNNLLLLEKAPGKVDELIGVYRKLYVDPENEELNQNYKEIVNEIDVIHQISATTITGEYSRVLYQGLHNVIKQIITEIASGVNEAKKGDLTKASLVYDSVTKKSYYLSENTAALALEELGLMHKFQDQMARSRKITIILSITLFATTIIGGLLLAFLYSKEIISPIMVLSDLALRITEGDFETEIPQELIERKDETGTLSSSFRSMLLRLQAQIRELNESNAKIKEAQESVIKKNKDLEKMNRIMVDRELRMTEMKKEIEKLKAGNTTS